MTRTTWLLGLLALGGCGGSSMGGESARDDPDMADTDVDQGSWDTGGADADGAPGAVMDTAPPEVEDDPLALAPAQSDVHIFIANPDRNTVTRVNALTREVTTTAVGAHPTRVAVTGDYQHAVVFNRDDATVSILDASTLAATTVPVRNNLNELTLSPDGAWAALWHDEHAERTDDPPLTGATSFNEVSLVHLATGQHLPLVVGFEPKDLRFTPDSRLAIVVSDATLALIELGDGTAEPTYVPIADDPLSPPIAEEVAVAPDGSYAFIRRFGTDALTILDLSTHEMVDVPVGLNPTDLDLMPDGTEVVVVSRSARELSIFQVDDPFAPPRVLSIPGDDLLGSLQLDATAERGILYTTASLSHSFVTWDVDTDELALRPLVKPARSVTVSATGESLTVIHTQEDNADGSTPEAFQGAWAISLMHLDDLRTNTLRLIAEPTGFAQANNGRFSYLIMEGQPYFEVIDHRTLIFEEIPLASPPEWIGVLPDLDASDGDEPPAWVSQSHALGRLSFFDPDTYDVETLTGFELNAAIED